METNQKLYRVESANKVLGGVCIGLSRYTNIDLTLLRVLFVVLFFTPVPIFIAYIIMWAVLPKIYESQLAPVDSDNNSNFNNNTMSANRKNDNFVGGIILIAVGSIFAFKTFFNIELFQYIGKLWPLIPIGIGVWLILKDRDNTNKDDFNSNNNIPESTNLDDSANKDITQY